MSELRENDVVRFDPPEKKGFLAGTDRHWCVEGMGVVHPRRDGGLMIVDSFWGGGPDQETYAPDNVEYEVLFNLDDFEQVPHYTWVRYAPTDRGLLTRQHGLQKLHYVRKGASEDHATIVETARQKLSDAEEDLSAAQWRVKRAQEDLAELTAEAVAP